MPAACGRRRRPTNEISVLGPAEAPLSLIRGRYRFRLLVGMVAAAPTCSASCGPMLDNGPKPRGSVRVQIDIDPQEFHVAGYNRALRLDFTARLT